MNARPTRSQHLAHLITGAVLAARLKWNEYAAAVVDHYHANVDATERVVEFHVATTADNHEKSSRLNTQTVRRLLSGEIRMPSDIEESLLAGLPRERVEPVLTELLGRQGLLLAHRPTDNQALSAQVTTPCELMRRAAEAVERIAPMLDDGRIGPEDAPHFSAALHAIHAVMGSCTTLTASIARVVADMAAKNASRAGARNAHVGMH